MTQTCSICLCDIVRSDKTEKLRCKHIYHKDCINKWKVQHNTCPVCRYVIGNVIRVEPVAAPVAVARVVEASAPAVSIYEYISNSKLVLDTKNFINLFNEQTKTHKIILGTLMIVTLPTAIFVGTIYGIVSFLKWSCRV